MTASDVSVKTIVITGASGLVGTPLAAALAHMGCRVLRAVRRPVADPQQEISWDPARGEIDAAALAFVEAGQQVGALRADQAPAVLIALVYGALAGLFRAHRLYGELVDIDAYDQAADAVWDMVRNGTTPDPTPDPKDER